MRAEEFLSRLQKVRPSGKGEWLACCPAHDDRSPSLGIKDAGETFLLHCFAGCDSSEVLGAVGLSCVDIMPPKPAADRQARPMMPFSPTTVLRAMAFNSQIVAIAASHLAQGKPLSVEDKDRLFEIAEEFNQAVNYVRSH